MFTTDDLKYLEEFVAKYNEPVSLPFYKCIEDYLKGNNNSVNGSSALDLPDVSDLPQVFDLPQVLVDKINNLVHPKWLSINIDKESKNSMTFVFTLKTISMPLSKRIQIDNLCMTFRDHLDGLVYNQSVDTIQELCCGKANLGLTLAHHYHLPFTGYDINSDLVTQLETRIVRCKTLSLDEYPSKTLNVLDDSDQNVVYNRSKTLTVALHACGELSDRIILNWVEWNRSNESALLVVPCCYDRFRPATGCAGKVQVNWLSKYYKKHDLPDLWNSELLHNLTTQIRGNGARQTKISNIITKKRLLKIALNLYLAKNDLGDHPLFKGYTHCSGYRSIPDSLVQISGLTKSSLSDALLEVLRRLLSDSDFHVNSGHSISEKIDFELLQEVEREAPRLRDIIIQKEMSLESLKLFLELALIDDRARYLSENGYSMTVRAFTQKNITPRNMAILAYRSTNMVQNFD